MQHSSRSNATVAPSLQNSLIDMIDAWASSGTMCALFISFGSQGMSKLHSWVEHIVSPLGMVILTGFCVGMTFVTGAPVMTKCPVVPESPIAMPFGMGLLGAALCANSVLVAWLSLEFAVARLLLAGLM